MNIKSLLLGSAAALAAVSGAQAADAIVAAEPEPMEYVRVCDAFGTGYFYIPGTETCLQIGGWVRFQVDFGRDKFGTSDWNAVSKAYLTFTAKNDTELGTLTSFIALEGDPSGPTSGGESVYVDEAFIQLGGFKAGYFYNWWDKGIVGETDSLGTNTLLNAVSYTYDGGAFQAGLAVEELEDAFTGVNADASNGVGISGIVTAAVGGVAFDLLGSYDTENEEGAIRGLLSAEVGPGTLQIAGIWASGQSTYWNKSEWSVAAAYALKATDKLTITPAIQYWDELYAVPGGEELKYGVTLGYEITDGLKTLVTVNYVDSDIVANDDQVTGFFRLQRSF